MLRSSFVVKYCQAGPPSEAMTIQEVAEFLQLSTRTIRRVANHDQPPFPRWASVRFSRRRYGILEMELILILNRVAGLADNREGFWDLNLPHLQSLIAHTC